MNRRPTHVPFELALEGSLARPVHDGRIVPTNQVPDVPPLHAQHVPFLRRVVEECLDQLGALGFRHARPVRVLQMVKVVGNVQVRPPRRSVELYDLVPSERERLRVHRRQVLGLGARLAPTVPEAVGADVVVLDELSLERVGQLGKRRARVCELRVASVAWRG